MLGSIVNCVKTAGVLITLSVILTACGAAGGLPEAQSIANDTPTPSSIGSGTIPNQDGLDSSTSLSISSVRNTTQTASSTPSTNLSGTIDRSPAIASLSSAQASSINSNLSGTINRSTAATPSSSAPANIAKSSVASSKANSVASSKANSVVSSKANSVASSKAAGSSVASSKSSSKASSSVASSKSSSKASSSVASSKASSSIASSKSSSKASSSAASSSKASSSVASSKSSSAASSKAANNSNLIGAGATIQWSHPTARENGTYLTIDEIGGYQIRYKALNGAAYTYISIPGNTVTQYNFPLAITGLQFDIAVYDKQGLYSDFVPIPTN